MDSTTLILAGVLAIGIVLIAVGIAGSGGSGISERLERYAAKPDQKKKATGSGQGGVADMIASSETLNSLNRVVEQRDFGANLARDIARADLHLKPSEFLMIGSSLYSATVMLLLSPPPTRHHSSSAQRRFLPRFWLARARPVA